MAFTESDFKGALHLLGYGGGGFRLSDEQVHDGSLLLLPGGPRGIALTTLAEMDAELVQVLIDTRAGYDVLLIGCGNQIAPLPAAQRALLDEADIPYDLMDTGAACRTFNVLLAEERRVAALLIAAD